MKGFWHSVGIPSMLYIFFLADSQNQIQVLAFVQYAFDRNEHPIELKSHGNSKKRNKLFSRSKPSTIEVLKRFAQEKLKTFVEGS